MKVYLEVGNNSRGLLRVRDALVKYAPSTVEVVSDLTECDLAVLHVWGRHSTTQKQINYLTKQKKKYAMIQYCLRSTMRDSTRDWIDMWRGSEVVWSYYNLFEMMDRDNIADALDVYTHPPFNFYYAPLGVDANVFYERPTAELHTRYVVIASAQHALSESVRECAFAAKKVQRRMFHLGHELRRGKDIVCRTGLTDDELAEIYSQSLFVSGLRREEGFELPVIEGALCGARPIVFDRPEMRKWFSEFAVFMPESPRGKVIDDLETIFRIGSYPVGEYEKMVIRDRFNWEHIISNFWKHL